MASLQYIYGLPPGTSPCRSTFIALSVSLTNDLADDVFDGMGLAGFNSIQGQSLFIGLSCSHTFCLLLFSLSLISLYKLVLYNWGVWTDRV